MPKYSRRTVSLACPPTFGEAGGSGSGLASPPGHGGGFHEHYQLDEMTAETPRRCSAAGSRWVRIPRGTVSDAAAEASETEPATG